MRKGYFDDDYDTGPGTFQARYHVRQADGDIYVSEIEVLAIPEDFPYQAFIKGWENIYEGMKFDPGDTEIVIPDTIIWE